jgi:hypothetical protein
MRALVALAFLFTSLIAQAQAPDPAMLQADAAFVQAVAKSDKAALDKLLDTEFTWTTAQGKTLTRAQTLQAIPTALITTTQAKDLETKSYTYTDLGDVQANQGRAHVLRVYVKRPAGWKAIVYQEVRALAAPPTVSPGAGKECENPCKSLQFTPKNDTERQVAQAYMKLETAAHARNAEGFAPMVADEFIAASSNSDRIQTKQSRIVQFNANKDAGVAPTPLLSAHMYPFSEAVLMISEHKPVQGNRLHVTRVWVKRGGGYISTMSYQTAVVQ